MADAAKARYLAEACNVDVHASAAALRESGGDVDVAAAVLLSAAEAQPAQASVATSPASTPLGVLLEMGYEAGTAATALRRSDGNLEGALQLLLEAPSPRRAQQPAPQQNDEYGTCAICTEPIQPREAAMRCRGDHGGFHYGHARCLGQWVSHCRERDQTPSCPMCRCPLQLRRRQIEEFLADNNPGHAECRNRDQQVLREMAQRVRDDGTDDFQDVDWCKVLGVAALTIMGGLAVGAFASLIAKENRKRREDD
eukprot:s6978_g2.t1